jgi:transposase-like protein
MTAECTPACVRCGSPRQVRTSGTTARAYYCGKCGIEFEPEEDGVVGYGRPEKYAVRNEAHAIAKRRYGRGTRRGGVGG